MKTIRSSIFISIQCHFVNILVVCYVPVSELSKESCQVKKILKSETNLDWSTTHPPIHFSGGNMYENK